VETKKKEASPGSLRRVGLGGAEEPVFDHGSRVIHPAKG